MRITMGRKRKAREIGGSKTYFAWKEWGEEFEVIGKYTGTSLDNYDKTNWHIEVEECNFDEELVGKTLCLNHNGSVAHKMKQVKIGEVVGFEMLGTETLKKGKFAGKECYNVKVTVYDEEGNTEELEATHEEVSGESVDDIL